MFSYWKLHKIPILLVLVSCVFYWAFAYDLIREDFIKLLTLYASLFFLFLKLIQFEIWNFKFLWVAGLLFRLVFLVADPNLSQDFYRFIWDGQLLLNGVNPYLFTPDELMQGSKVQIPNAQILYEGMGSLSAKNFSNYPPINQFLFAAATFLGMGKVMGSVIWLRILIITADLGTVYFGRKLLLNLNLSPNLIFWYFLNPLIIIELTGNLHFEGAMLFFFIWALYLISIEKYLWATPIYAASILLKLVPILFLPLFLRHFGFKKALVFYTSVIVVCLLYLIPFYTSEFIANYSKTIGLWFSNFEFNASMYNLVKYIGVDFFEAKPWELIKSYGSGVKIATGMLILTLAFSKKHQKLVDVIASMFIVLLSYYFLSATVHPWYLVFLLGLGLFTQYKFTIWWSALVILSYYAYSQPDFRENLALLAIEYLLVFGYMGYEIAKNHNILALIRKNN